MTGHGLDDASERDLLATADRVAADAPLLGLEDDLLRRLERTFGLVCDAIDALRDGGPSAGA